MDDPSSLSIDKAIKSTADPQSISEGTPLIQYHGQKGRQEASIFNDRFRPEIDPYYEWENQRWRIVRMEILFLSLLMVVSASFIFDLRWNESSGAKGQVVRGQIEEVSHVFAHQAGVKVRVDRPSFPSYLTYAPHGPINVTYDKRSIMLNDTRVLFLSGSLHPARATPETWLSALDEAVRHGLNMVTIYVFWSAHQPFPDQQMDWSLPDGRDCGSHDITGDLSCHWNLASAIQAAARRGFFVHIRIGPYTCAEYNYGGIPEWVPLSDPKMEMRRPNQQWMDVMEKYVTEVVDYLSANRLWAHQGGPIVLGQIENELHGETDKDGIINVEDDVENQRTNSTTPSMQDHANWCGKVAARAAPNVVWTMCMGLTAPNTINTCNGAGDDCSVSYLESHGQTGRIQIDQPALWTENEGGFQVWGEEPEKPTDYFWGRTARSYAKEGMKWFARGGSHLNYYMWWGSYNRGRTPASGITNMYASDAPMCPSGERRQPKFDHLHAFHELMADIAWTLLNEPSALGAARSVEHRGEDGQWKVDPQQRIFVYGAANHHAQEVVFVENDADSAVDLRIPVHNGTSMKLIRMKPTSAMVLVDGMNMFDSATIKDGAMSYQRHIQESPVQLLRMHSWLDLNGKTLDNEGMKITSDKPIEQTELMLTAGILSDYAWYETSFSLDNPLHCASLSIDTQKGNAVVVFFDKQFVGKADNHEHDEGNITLSMDIGTISRGNHRLLILSESLGYHNLIGAFGTSTRAKPKGTTGAVMINGTMIAKTRDAWNQNLVDGRPWMSFAGLRMPEETYARKLHKHEDHAVSQKLSSSAPCTWTKAFFDTPTTVHRETLFLDIPIGRGRLWLNGHDLGRFWNITRGDSTQPTQRYYFLPKEFLFHNGQLNELVIFNSLGGDTTVLRLVLSWVKPSDKPTLIDEVDNPLACLL